MRRSAAFACILFGCAARLLLRRSWFERVARSLRARSWFCFIGPFESGAREGTRTPNLPITNRLRCQLRHPGSGFTPMRLTQKRSAKADRFQVCGFNCEEGRVVQRASAKPAIHPLRTSPMSSPLMRKVASGRSDMLLHVMATSRYSPRLSTVSSHSTST